MTTDEEIFHCDCDGRIAGEHDYECVLKNMKLAREDVLKECVNCKCKHEGQHSSVGSCECGCDIYISVEEWHAINKRAEKAEAELKEYEFCKDWPKMIAERNAKITRLENALDNHRICLHCYETIASRNKSGFCDHLYYPENCKECQRLRTEGERTDKHFAGPEGPRQILKLFLGRL